MRRCSSRPSIWRTGADIIPVSGNFRWKIDRPTTIYKLSRNIDALQYFNEGISVVGDYNGFVSRLAWSGQPKQCFLSLVIIFIFNFSHFPLFSDSPSIPSVDYFSTIFNHPCITIHDALATLSVLPVSHRSFTCWLPIKAKPIWNQGEWLIITFMISVINTCKFAPLIVHLD